ncbi:MAG: hypothetical protein ACFFEK_17665 [Candidatus Thorarchaeota archaeon]
MVTHRELIASTAGIEKIAEYIKADAWIYPVNNTLEDAIGLQDLCLACLDDEYSTKHAKRIRDKVQELETTPNGSNYERDLSE